MKTPSIRRFLVLVMLAAGLAGLLAAASGAKTLEFEPPSAPFPNLRNLGEPQNPSKADQESASEDTRIPGRYIVVFKDSVDHPGNLAEAQTEQRNGDLGFVYRSAIKGYSAKLSKAAVEALREDPRVKYVSPDRKIELFSQAIPNGIVRTLATENATADIDGVSDSPVNVDVAVIDTGVDSQHPDLNVYKRTNCVPPGEGFISEAEEELEECIDDTGADGVGHGTHVAGTIGAIDNGEGVVGMAPGARLWSVRVFASDGFGTLSWTIAGFDWVWDRASEIEVANASLGCVCSNPPLEEVIDAMTNAGIVVVVAAGNSKIDVKNVSPAKNKNAITVSAMADYDGIRGEKAAPLVPWSCEAPDETGEANYGIDDWRASFSNYGEGVDVTAPGVCIYSARPGGKYGFSSGTSMAAPHVAGAAALLASKSNPSSKSDVEALAQQLKSTGNQSWVESDYREEGAESTYDKVQEPLLDVGPTGFDAYTTGATRRSMTEATLHGGVNPNGSSTSYQFEYGTTESYGAKAPSTAKSVGSGSADVKVSETLGGLKPNTTYHYRVVANGTASGGDRTFKTAASVFTYTAVDVEASSATLKGSVNPSGVATSYQFEYGTTESYGTKIPLTPKSIGSGQDPVQLSEPITGLSPNTTYHYRLTALAGSDTFHGKDLTFTTPLAVITGGAGPNAHSARLTGSVNPLGQETSYQFEYGTTTSYGNQVPASPQAVGSGIKAIEVTSAPQNLKANTAYHYRVAGTSKAGTSYGADRTFTTTSSALISEAEFTEISAATTDFHHIAVGLWKYWGFEVPCGPMDFGASMDGPAESFTASSFPVEANCPLWGGEVNAPLEMDGCEFIFHPGTRDLIEESKLPIFDGTVDIGGSNCAGLTLEINHGLPYCKFTVLPQSGLPARYEQIDEGPATEINVFVRKYNLKYKSYGGSACPSGMRYDGGYIGAWRIRGQNLAGQEVDLRITDAYEVAPTAATKPVSGIKTNAATLHGAVNPNFLETSYQFEYGTTTAYGSKAPGSPQSAGAGDKDIAVSQAIEGLEPATIYHYRVVAINAEGTTYGEDATFTTWGAWSSQSTPNPPLKPRSQLNDVSCPSSTLCVAAGTDSYAAKGALQRWDGSEWKTIEGLGFLVGKGISAISCASTASCVITPALENGESPFVWNWNPSSSELAFSTIQALSTPSEGSNVKLNDVSCTASNACTAVGSYLKGGVTKTLAERWNGSSWSIQTTTNPESGDAELLGVSCDSSTSCTAVGRQDTKTLAMRWNGSSWSMSSTPNPSGAPESRLANVSCASASFCMAVGHHTESSNSNKKTLAEKWDGSSWSVVASPNPAENKGASLLGVSCASSTSCTAVGRYATAAGFGLEAFGVTEEKTLALSWGGSEWATQSTPNPEGKKLSRLAGVSCSSSTACTAVGWGKTSSSDSETVTVGERYG